MSEDLAAQIAKRFIQRRDVKAVQFTHGGWSPDRELKNLGRYAPPGFKMKHLLQHIEGTHTYGHYLLDANDKCRLFAFDIDLLDGKGKPVGTWVHEPGTSVSPWISNEEWDAASEVHPCDPRGVWADRKQQQARAWLKYQMKMLAAKFIAAIGEIGVASAAAYSGSKGIHVYGFTGEMSAKEVREGALLVLDIMDEFEPTRGENFFQHKNDNPVQGYRNFIIEVFPKQDSLDGKDLGNLLRLPLGRNLKSADPTFFLDMTCPMAEFKPHSDPVKLLETGNPYL